MQLLIIPRMNKHESGNCSLCGLAETVEHVLINCTAYKNERKCLVGELKEMGIGNITIKKLLNNGLENYRVYKALIKYLRKVHLFNRI